MTDSAEENLDLDVVFSWIAPRNGGGCQGRRFTCSGVSFRVVHVATVDQTPDTRYAECAKLYAEYAISVGRVLRSVDESGSLEPF